ncbi:MAG: DUF6765 family protein [Rhodothermaceae bacterium]
MQKDMHYYGIYVLARAAGIKKETAQIIASSSQFVDDSVEKIDYDHIDGSKIKSVATAHHSIDIKNVDPVDQRYVWVPFHFLPGGKGETFTEKLICVKNSNIAIEMRDNAIANYDKEFSAELMGVTAHVYADTFAHYGFSGVSSTKNQIINDSINVEVVNPDVKDYIEGKFKAFFDDFNPIYENIRSIISTAAETFSGALGHGAVATYPDRPYLKWNFKYEYDRIDDLKLDTRDNKVTFMEACEQLFNMFKEYANNKIDVKDVNINQTFEDIKENISDIISFEGNKKDRSEQWSKSLRENLFFESDETEVPKYLGLDWLEELENLDNSDIEDLSSLEVYKYFQAAEYHLNYVLRELLPKNEIYVI